MSISHYARVTVENWLLKSNLHWTTALCSNTFGELHTGSNTEGIETEF